MYKRSKQLVIYLFTNIATATSKIKLLEPVLRKKVQDVLVKSW